MLAHAGGTDDLLDGGAREVDGLGAGLVWFPGAGGAGRAHDHQSSLITRAAVLVTRSSMRGAGRRSGGYQQYWVHAGVRGDAANWPRRTRHGQRGQVGCARRGHRRPQDRRFRAPGHRCVRRGPHRAFHADRTDRRGRRRGRLRRGVAGGDDLLQHVRGSGPRQGGPLPAGDDGAVRGPRAVHRALPRPDAAGPALPAGRHHARPRPAVLGHVGRHPQPGDAAARRVRHPGPAEGLRRGARVGHPAAAARGNHPGDRERAVPAHGADRLHAGRGGGGGDRDDGRGRVGAAGRDADLPRRHVPRPAAARAGRLPGARPGRGTADRRSGPAAEPHFPPNERGRYPRSPDSGPRAAPNRGDRTRTVPYERPGRGEPRSLPPGAGSAPADSFWTTEPDEAPEEALARPPGRGRPPARAGGGP